MLLEENSKSASQTWIKAINSIISYFTNINLSFHVTIILFLFKTPRDVLQMCHITFNIEIIEIHASCMTWQYLSKVSNLFMLFYFTVSSKTTTLNTHLDWSDCDSVTRMLQKTCLVRYVTTEGSRLNPVILCIEQNWDFHPGEVSTKHPK